VTGERPEESSRGAEIGKFVNGYVLSVRCHYGCCHPAS